MHELIDLPAAFLWTMSVGGGDIDFSYLRAGESFPIVRSRRRQENWKMPKLSKNHRLPLRYW